MWRARLAIACADELDADECGVMAVSAACELVHQASVVHDDVQDQATMRRGQLSLAARFGAAPDANAGMKLAAFAPTGAWVGGLALIVPSVGGLLALVGALYTLFLFYDGAQRLFPVEPVKARMLGFAAVLASILLNMLIGLAVGILFA
jgi:hypothetical protein